MNQKHTKQEENETNRLPYLNRLPSILIVLGINLAFGLLQPLWGLTHLSILIDAAICGVTTPVIGVFLTRHRLRKLAETGALPAEPPHSKLICALPKNPWLLSIVFAAVCVVLLPVFTEMLLRFYDITAYTQLRFLAWKLVYSAFLSAKATELAILRLVQPDCLRPGDPKQIGQAAVKNPLPKGETFTKLFDTVTTDFGFNMLVGLVLGGTLIIDQNVVIPPTTLAGIVISGAILGAIVVVRMVYPVVKAIRLLRENGTLPSAARRNPWVAWLPQSPALFALALSPVVIVLTPIVFWGVFTFFGFESLDFFQYFIVRTIYVSLLTKPVVKLAILRYMQPQLGIEGSTVHV